ncbi:GNAT family N-acetyltransferase [Pseudophaeobacter sp. EL27]|uniref:GNAT family N-acetyltransferase n=1 Tax=Pseudophaeobacter sp. EL27 TaxID=2107580 RepID=UPI000EFCEA63|nr:GNAT family N-acyltransferase [Pseudophaeobacter sp. EL27]
MADSPAEFTVSLAKDETDLREAQALRYEVFVSEMGADGALVDHHEGLEKDQFDAFCDHMIIRETETGRVVGVYRLMRSDQALAAGEFYSESEYDLAPLTSSGRRLLELGRSCLHPQFRGGTALFYLWAGLNDYVSEQGIEILFGTASFAGTNLDALSGPLTVLNQDYLAPEPLRCRSRRYQSMDLLPADAVDRKRAMVDCPALIKAYLRLGGMVGDGAFIDHDFNTTDVMMILDTARMTARQKRFYSTDKVKG